MSNITVLYYENIDGTWDACNDTCEVRDAENLEAARVVTRILLREELGEFFVKKEIINYYDKA